jgi:hypothetical protein
MCYDVNLGANAFIQMLQLGAAILSNQNKEYGLIILGDTPSKLTNNSVLGSYEISDAASAIILRKTGKDFTIEIENATYGEYYKAHILREGGFRDFNPSRVFDARESENFRVTEDEVLLNAVSKKHQFHETADSEQMYVFCHSNCSHFYKEPNGKFWLSAIFADASELPIALADKTSDIEPNSKLSFYSMGEGVAFYALKINHTPICLKTEKTDEVFSDYRVSHEM